jgi:hypothetical protein
MRPVLSEPPFHVRHRRWLIGWGLTAALFLAFVVNAANDTGGSSTGSSGTSVDDKYDQTWSKSYSRTTCGEWNGEMTADQQWAAAADMLTSARNKGDGGQGLPPDYLVDAFVGGIDAVCVVRDMSLAEAGASLYLTERARFRP